MGDGKKPTPRFYKKVETTHPQILWGREINSSQILWVRENSSPPDFMGA
jgi:hypothetical protein